MKDHLYKLDTAQERLKESKSQTRVCNKKLEGFEREVVSVLGDMKSKATKVHLEEQEVYMELLRKYHQCQLEKSGGSIGDSSGEKYPGYEITNGKCRKSDKYSYNRKHVYNLKNTDFKVNSE